MFGNTVIIKVTVLVIAGLMAVLWLARPSQGSGPERAYVVRPADTLWSIATRHYPGDPREGVWKLRERNDLESSVLRPGQALVLPPG